MNNNFLKLFELNNTNIDEIKTLYRKLAKQNHPDYFTDNRQKKKQEMIMEKINEAYNVVLNKFKESQNKIKSEQSVKKSDVEDDYLLYKRGIIFFNIYYHSFFQLFAKREVKTSQEKEAILYKAKSYFDRILKEYPKSEWIYDSKEKLKKIEKTIEMLKK